MERIYSTRKNDLGQEVFRTNQNESKHQLVLTGELKGTNESETFLEQPENKVQNAEVSQSERYNTMENELCFG